MRDPDLWGAAAPRRRWLAASGIAVCAVVAVGIWVGAGGADAPAARATEKGPSSRSTATAGLDPKDIVDVLPPDGIPALDDPSFIPPNEATWLSADEPVIALELDGEARAYPLQIMTWHEIANDVIGDTPVAVTFCPLCNTAIAFERPRLEGRVTTFGTSGKLINSNLLMYDRATESLWPQVTGVALTGPMKGRSLRRLPAQIVSWADFRAAYPTGMVLSRDTGFDRRYGENPYPGYDDVDRPPFLYTGKVDGRLAAVERVLGVSYGDEQVAFPYSRLRARARGEVAVAEDAVEALPVVVLWKKGTTSALDQTEISVSRDVGSAAAFSRRLGGHTLSFTVAHGSIVDAFTNSTWNIFGRATSGKLQGWRLDPVDSTDSFWFAWAAFHPETQVWPGMRR